MPNHPQAARELGVPVKAVFHTALHPYRDAAGVPSLFAVMSQHVGGMIIAEINLTTGACRQWNADIPGAEGGISLRSPRDGTVYVATAGHLLRLTMARRELEVLGKVDAFADTHAVQLDEGPDGVVWMGSFPRASLASYDPATGKITDHGRMDETDMYFYPRAGSDGTVAGLVRMCFPHVVAWDRAAGRGVTVGPTVNAEHGHDQIALVKAADGLLYIDSVKGKFRLRGATAEPIDAVPTEGVVHAGWGGRHAPKQYGFKAHFTDPAVCRKLRVAFDGGETRDLTLNWRGDGTSIYKLHLGPDGLLYGSSILPEHIFTCETGHTPGTQPGDKLTNHGPCSLSTGEAYTMGNLDGKLFICSYPNARLSVYDPKKPYVFTGEDEASNPRDVGRIDPVACRPLAMVAGPLGRVWIGSVPDYGMWGGTLTSYDPKTGKKTTHRHLMQDCSVVSLAWLPALNRMLVGTTVWAGSGAKPRVRTGGFVLWDIEKEHADWTETFGLDPINGVYDLKVNDDGTVYALCFLDATKFEKPDDDRPVKPELTLLDIAGRRLLKRAPLPESVGRPLEWALQRGPDGATYGAGKKALYRIKPGTVEIEHAWDAQDGTIDAAGPIVRNRFFFASHHRVRCVDI
ncbi:MAG: hypothetical protein K8S99_10785 [Planctomycetes bacterium]|nr:hypothetical protein [Planctomycetota bacterium]